MGSSAAAEDAGNPLVVLMHTMVVIALVHALGGRASFGVVCGTAVVTLFHSSIVMLAKLFLDPFNNEVESRGGDPGIGGIEVDTLLQQTNVGSERWRRSAASA